MLNIHIALFALINCIYAASQIALFTDSNCLDSYKGLEGPNGYPNGSCTDFRRSGTYGSLQVVGLDSGCAVTIYVNDPETTICGGYQEEIQIGECWNSTFVYYSIDMCDIPTTSLTPSITPLSSSSPSASSGPATGILVGGIVGGLAGLGLILGFALWILARKKRARKHAAVQEHRHPAEMNADYHRHEMSEGKVVYKNHAAEVAQPPIELGGLELTPHELGDYETGRSKP
ncbi:hypothetical protein BU25DRAFT_409630 [Macroventuria anomochaeta]|uniref:Uncharacterized protein n=1 Tax=Macroventuria anomochaeta TaxID=301207 RepID=A0ACB6S730_9PLEO|nr:uncharacterized protein BU25DRAFT_409630 [Macroventuria anomochaeta]KAF2629168.1 hypothetical protein BU25DRAFT_409630 [Macroventuria anomochaeta]